MTLNIVLELGEVNAPLLRSVVGVIEITKGATECENQDMLIVLRGKVVAETELAEKLLWFR